MKHLLTTLLLLAATILSERIERAVRFDDQKLVRVARTPKAIKAAEHLDVWGESKTTLDIRVDDKQLAMLKRKLHSVKVIDNNIQHVIDAETVRLNAASKTEPTISADWFTEYHRYADIVTWFKKLSTDYSQLVSFTSSIGKSVESRDIILVKITSQKGDYKQKKRIWLQGLQHAREWISGATMQYLSYYLATNYGKNSRVTNLLDQVEFVIVPVCNPDGYEYTWTGNRLWRKNLAKVNGSKQGVDPNRNWPDHWGNGGSSTDPSDETYMGPSPASEPEIRALMAAYSATPNVIGAIDYHSYSELILRPFGWTDSDSPDEAAFAALGDDLHQTISGIRGRDYTSERVVDLYVASGGSNDWWYGEGTKSGSQKVYAFAIELSPNASETWGGQGFILPPSQIIPVGNDMAPTLLEFTEYALKHPLGTK